MSGFELRRAAAAADAARSAEARHDAAMARLLWCGLPQLLAVMDTNGQLRAANPAWQQLLRLDTQQLRGRSFLTMAHADDRAAAGLWLHRVAEGAGPATFNGRWQAGDGGYQRIAWTLALRDGLACAMGQPGVAGTEALPTVAVQARQQTLRTVARLSSGLSHDFNNLLQVLRNALELIQQRPDEPRQVMTWAASALRIVERGSQLTAQLLAFASTQQLRPQTVQVGVLLHGMQERLQRLLRPQVQLQLDLPAGGALATGDPAQLELAVLNLALNAMDAMPQGGRLTIGCGRSHVENDAELATGDYVCINVTDTGTGMSDVVRDRAFEPFFTTKALGQGQGLGLSQVYGFVQQIGGAVRIDSHPGGGGNTVRMLLPEAGLAPLKNPAAAVEVHSDQAQPRVLVVVDDAERRQLLLSSLTLQGYRHVQAVDAASARQQIEHNQYDVILLGLPARPISPDELARRG